MTESMPLEIKQVVRATRRFMLLLLISLIASHCTAQDRQSVDRCCNVAPGLAGQGVLLRNPSLAVRRQAVQIITPPGSLISVLSNQGSPAELDSNINIGLSIGQVYRLKVSNIPRFSGYEVYPSIEVIGHLDPPAGMENQFPIKVVLTADDLEKALQGRLVIKVVYLEDPTMSLPYRQQESDQPYFDIGRHEDPLRTAKRLGRPMAIIRMGSRLPTSDEVQSPSVFDFYRHPVEFLPVPQPIQIPDSEENELGQMAPDVEQSPSTVKPVTYLQVNNDASQRGIDPPEPLEDDFTNRAAVELEPQINLPEPQINLPEPIGRQLMRRKAEQKQRFQRYDRTEYIFDGQDSGRPVTVDLNWNVYGLGIEDTVGHFDTLDGQRLVTPSNRVAIYAPRFSAVRKLNDLGESFTSISPSQFEEDRQTIVATGSDFSATTKQHDQLLSHRATNHVLSIMDQTRGVTADNVIVLFGVRNSFSPYENLEVIRFGRFNSAEKARLELGILSASIWQDDLELQVSVGRTEPVSVKKVNRVEQFESVDSDDNAVLRVFKIASHIAARPGDIVEFTIRFDNLSNQKIGNVTLIDNLTSRLEFVPGSAESSHHATFVTEQNEADSLQLRWEIRDPLPKGEGGLVRFKCRVR